ATLYGFHRWESTSFLLDQVVLNAPSLFCGLKDLLPLDCALAEQNRITLGRLRRPVFAVHRGYATRVGFDPCDRVGPCVHACTDIELEHNVLAGVCRKDLDRAPTF